MSKEKRRVPKLRFPGFTEDWEQRKADYIFKSVTDKGYPELPVLSASQELGMVYREQNGIDIQHDKKNEASYKRVLPGQFVIHLRSFQGGFAYSEIEGITSPAYTVMSFKNSNEQYGLFWKHIFKSETFIKRLETITYGIRDGRSISFSDFKSLILQYPSFSEQKMIGDSIAIIEIGITLHQRKLEHLNLKKKALLQKLFPKNGERYPELRFPGFTDAWEQRKLGDLTPLRGGFAFKSTEFKATGVPVIRISNILSDSSIGGDFAYYLEQNNDENYVLPNNALVIAMSGATTGKAAVLKNTGNIKFYQNQRVGYFQNNLKCDYSFISTLVKSSIFLKQMESVLVAGAQPNISSKEIDSFIFKIPISTDEQRKISKLFNMIDSTITLHQRKLDHLQLQKKALLQQMFV